ncbi:MAG TPA: 1,4-alpha-glucan branching protein GlgB [Aquihabitans sp.]|jgi:1,4-alpha-glucan branching enzyme|nr:1,4-alpha-glucan branching protein GlgB [Aquihabitans sp.]
MSTHPADPAGLVGELDRHLLSEGRHLALHQHLGAHPRTVDGAEGVAFAVWAPAAQRVTVVGDWNHWDRATTPLERVDGSEVWAGFSADAHEGHRYKFAITGPDGATVEHADPLAFRTEGAPATASIVHTSRHRWADDAWLTRRDAADQWASPMSVYEVHLGSWRRDPAEPDRERTFRELAPELAAYVTDLGFTHVELLPVMGHPFAGSWGYQVTSYFAPAARWGEPDDLRFLIDTLHQAGVGVILDWVPAHFPKDEWALGRFDGTPLYEHPDPRRGEQPDWGTYVFDFGRGGVRSFLLSNARFWLEEYHVDGLRVDAVASMLYLDYSRAHDAWLPNDHGGRENLEAVSLLQEANVVIHADHPGVLSIAEESTAWPGVSRPVDGGGLGFGFKWNMGWMHDTLDYFSHDPIHRRYHHHDLTFSTHYAFTENFVLPLSHDEVVHGKGSLLTKMPGDRWQQLANVRALFGWMWAHPGKQLLFMGGEFAQEREWDHDRSIDWHLLADQGHAGVHQLVRDLNRTYRGEPALWEVDFAPGGFTWLVGDDADGNVAAFLRRGADGRAIACVANLSPTPRYDYVVGLPTEGRWCEVLNTDAELYGGSGVGNLGAVVADGPAAHGQPTSATATLPPLGVVWFQPEGAT